MTEHAREFTELRPLLFTIAYEITGSTADADDVLQDSWLRWSAVDLATVEHRRAYLARVVSRQALNALRASSRRREEYVGPWLPEPLLVSAGDLADDVVLGESVSMAVLLVLESLSPAERVVFVLREVFGFEHAEIAGVVGRTPAAVRQLAHRAREHVEARRPRYEPRGDEAARAVQEFLRAAGTGDLDGLLAVLDPDVVLVSDGGGKVSALRHPLRGAADVARFVLGLFRLATPSHTFGLAGINGAPGVVVRRGHDLEGVFCFDVQEGRVVGVYGVRNPDKLASLAQVRRVGR
ncbi:RNA polymerase sigma-70 factor [Cellulomonas wangsupingiae]|uniref:RNA polymerase sigma-70 factor n=1 Tax=Cellulomonas wangsupingiae TaxID=2968085 RepID=UPI001D0EF730|nr:RNA polymerase sigma-70 factor [Cellulomonas wangsupingiae]MCM0640934.1 RNA polymerase sigma-70 factor [Cellulomonas wangsupingiae]